MTAEVVSKALADTIYYMKTQTEADRVIVCYEGIGRCHGFNDGVVTWDEATLSTEMLSRFVERGEPVLVRDSLSDPEFGHRTSALLSELGSVLFVPVRNEFEYTRGFLYLDQVGRSTFLAEGFFERIKKYVNQTLEPALHCKREHLTWEEMKNLRWS